MTESWQQPSPALGSKLLMVFALYSLFILLFVSWMHTLNSLVCALLWHVAGPLCLSLYGWSIASQ